MSSTHGIWLVTGAAGFIGSNLCEHLLSSPGNRVVGLDNFSSGKRENAARLMAMAPDRLRMVEGDIRDRATLDALMPGCGVVVHLAAQVSVPASFDDPVTTSLVNEAGFLNTLIAAGEAGVKRFLFASSCAVYGNNPNLPLAEGEIPQPESPYAVSKLGNERHAASLALRYPHMEMAGFRFFNIFGPWQDHQGGYAAVIPKWIHLLLAGKKPQLYGDGSATRDFCYVGNLCALLAATGTREGPLPPGPFNVGSGVGINLLELYETLTRILRGRISLPDGLERLPGRKGEILHSRANIDKSVAELGYRVEVGLEKGLARLLATEHGILS